MRRFCAAADRGGHQAADGLDRAAPADMVAAEQLADIYIATAL
jgi:hypothetical protein